MAKGRKSKNLLPDFIEISSDGQKARCTICLAAREQNGNGWINKGSVPNHLKSDNHANSLEYQRIKQSIESAGQQSIEQESALEESMDFSILSSTIQSEVPESARAPQSTEEEQEMWRRCAFGNEVFDAGIDHTAAAAEERKRLEREANDFDLWHGADFLPEEDPNDGELLLDELEQDDILSELLRNAHLNAPDAADLLPEELRGASEPKIGDAWSPYESKMMFLLDTLDNLPRMRVSNSLMNVFLWILREGGARDVPSLYHLRKVQASLRKSIGVPTTQHKSPKGNIYSMNDPRTLVAMDWANPAVCNHIRRYPVIPRNGVISEVYHAQKWRKDVDRHTLSPMYDAGNCHYYIDEVARLKNGTFVIPVRWLEDEDGNVCADSYAVMFDQQCVANVVDSETIVVQASDLQNNFLDLKDMSLLPTWSSQAIESGHPARMPNPDRALAEGDPLYTSWIDVFGDDVSGNRSKSWNKHLNIYINHRNLPRKFLQQEFHTHFVSTSPVASITEQFHGIKQVIESTHKKPVKVRHGTSGTQMRFKINVNCGPGDNPVQSEVCGHIGGNGNQLCRKCHAGGTHEVKASDEGFHSLFEPGKARSAEEIVSEVEYQVQLACLGIAQHVQNQQTKTGIKDAYTQYWIDYLIDRARTLHKEHPGRTTADIQVELLTWVQEHKSEIYNPFLKLDGFNAAVDTPVEILHTILLGIVKYLWHGSHTTWTVNQKQIYSVRLQSTDTSGLSIHAIRANYIMQYANSLIGRQFKTIAQVNVFHVYDLVDPIRFLLTKAVGELTALLWMPEIPNMEEYLSDVEIAAANVLDLFALIDPSKMTSKLKLHLLVHLKADILRFGPLVGVAVNSSEGIESQWMACRFAIASSGDECLVGSWVFATSPFNARQSVTGRIVEILAESEGKRAVVVIDVFEVRSTRHEIFGMPMLARRNEETVYVVIPSTNIGFLYNVQHDCPLAKCTASGKQPLMQERVESGLFKTYMEHKPIERFVVNTHGFHNAHRLRMVLERSLVVPILLHPLEIRKAKHTEIARSLQATQKVKHEARAARKKKEPVSAVLDKAGSVIPTKRMRSEMEAEADDTEMATQARGTFLGSDMLSVVL